MIIATWVGIGLIIILSIVGWLFAYNRYSRNEARHIGRLEGKVDSLGESMGNIEKRMGNLEQRIDNLAKR